MRMTLREAIEQTLDALRLRSRNYYTIFRSPAGAEVLADLAKFCRATQPCWGATPHDTARYVGRNEVWCRIMQHLNLTPEELYALYGGNYPITTEEQGS